jgi:serine/threonine-protein kinase RsbW
MRSPQEEAEKVSLSLPAMPANLTVVRQVVTGAALVAGMGEADIEDIKVAVTEACTNVIVHAYPDGGGTMAIEVWTSPSQIVVSVADAGRGIAPATESDRGGLGLGMGLMSALAQVVDVNSEPGKGTQVRMTFGANGDHSPPFDEPPESVA